MEICILSQLYCRDFVCMYIFSFIYIYNRRLLLLACTFNISQYGGRAAREGFLTNFNQRSFYIEHKYFYSHLRWGFRCIWSCTKAAYLGVKSWGNNCYRSLERPLGSDVVSSLPTTTFQTPPMCNNPPFLSCLVKTFLCPSCQVVTFSLI